MKKAKIVAAVILVLIFVTVMLAGCGKDSSSQKTKGLSGDVKVLAMNGAGQEIAEKLPGDYKTTEIKEYSKMQDKIKNGNFDLAIVSANTAAKMYSKTKKDIVALSPVTLGGIYVLSNGLYFNDPGITDVRNKTIYVLGDDSAAEYVLGKLMDDEGLSLTSSVDIVNVDSEAELSQKFLDDSGSMAVMTEPMASRLEKKDNIRKTLDLSDIWETSGYGEIPTDVLVAEGDFVNEHGDEINTILSDFGDAVDEAQGGSASSLVFYDASNRGISMLKNYMKTMSSYDSASVGGKQPGKAFYYSEN